MNLRCGVGGQEFEVGRRLRWGEDYRGGGFFLST